MSTSAIPVRMSSRVADDAPREPSRFLLSGFFRYQRRLLKKHFQAVGVSQAAPLAIADDQPLVVYANHASWWDPMIGLFLARTLFPGRTLYAPIDAAALERYRILRRMGFFGVQQDRPRGAAQFLRAARAILKRPRASIWMTPEGRFSDPRDDSAPFQPGLAHLASQLERGVLLPLAVEYPFWEERLPAALVRFGAPQRVEDHPGRCKDQWNAALVAALRQSQRELAADSIARRQENFEIVLGGARGAGGLYEWARRLRSWFSGRTHQAHHGEKLQ